MNPKADDPFEGSAITSILVVKDLQASKHFYTKILGAELYREYGGTSIVIQFLGHWMLLVTEGGPTPDKPQTVFQAIPNKHEVSHAFTIRVKDCEASYQILKDRGASFITPPHVNGAETRCFLHDPNGHLFEISSYDANN